MSFKFSDLFSFMQYIPFVDRIVAIVHDVSDSDSTRDKAADVVSDVLDVLVPLVETRSPALKPEIEFVVGEIKTFLEKYSGDIAPAPTPTPTPTPANDPTTARYSSLVDAKLAATQAYPLVIQYPDNRYGVWPNISLPSGATQVYSLNG